MRITELMERPQSRDLLADWYRAALAEQEDSGLSVAEYADEIGVSAATLYQWRRRLESTSSDKRQGGPELIEIVVPEQAALDERPVMRSSLTVHLGSSRSIEVSADFDPVALREVVRALESC